EGVTCACKEEAAQIKQLKTKATICLMKKGFTPDGESSNRATQNRQSQQSEQKMCSAIRNLQADATREAATSDQSQRRISFVLPSV
ncbi:MAG: hypothetical protein WB561_20610, partial [Terracidiphilus sp.]